MDDKRYLQTLIREGEHQQQDFTLHMPQRDIIGL